MERLLALFESTPVGSGICTTMPSMSGRLLRARTSASTLLPQQGQRCGRGTSADKKVTINTEQDDTKIPCVFAKISSSYV